MEAVTRSFLLGGDSLPLLVLRVAATAAAAYWIATHVARRGPGVVAAAAAANAAVAMRSPRLILAEAIAGALAEYFVVDPRDVEASLFQDAGVTLHHLELKPRDNLAVNARTTARVTGAVRRVAFSWKWGADTATPGGSSFVNSAQLALEGLQFRICLIQSDEAAAAAAPAAGAPDDATTDPAVGPAVPVGFIRDQVNRILEALTLVVADCEVTLELPGDATVDGNDALTFGMAGVRIASSPRSEAAPELAQELALEGLFAGITAAFSGPDAARVPVLDPVSYTLHCTRATNRSLESLLQRGLRVVGASNDRGVIVHAGPAQVQFFTRLGNCLLSAAAATTSTTGGAPDTVHHEPLAPLAGSDTLPSPKEPLPDSTEPCSSLQLPLAALSLVLDYTNTQISVSDLLVNYSLDGSQLTVRSGDGILVDGSHLFALRNGGRWQADLVDHRFTVRSGGTSTATDPALTIRTSSMELARVQKGLQSLLSNVQEMSVKDATVNPTLVEEQAKEQATRANEGSAENQGAELPPNRPWTFDVESLDFVLEGDGRVSVVEFSVRDLLVATETMDVTIGAVDTLRLPQSIRLQQPLQATKLSYDGSLLDLRLGDAVAVLEEPDASRKPVNSADGAMLTDSATDADASQRQSSRDDAANEPFVLPFGIHLLMDSFIVYETDGCTVHTTAKGARLAVGPDTAPADGRKLTGDVRLLVMMEAFAHDMLAVDQMQLSAIVNPHNRRRVNNLEFGASRIAIATGYSVFDWKRLFLTGDEKREPEKKTERNSLALQLPYAHIHELKIKLAVKATLVSTEDATLYIPAFRGDATTTLNDLVVAYCKRVLVNAPGFVRNVDVLGINLSDTAANVGGTVLMGGALGALGGAAMPVAGVLGMVGFDAVRNTINAGKRGRGAEDDDKPAAGDFFRGLGQLAAESARSGAATRGKSLDERADALDWALGATSTLTQYADQNLSRLGGAGAGAVGFGVGFVFGGPLGAVAGAVLANRATKGTIDAVDQKLLQIKE